MNAAAMPAFDTLKYAEELQAAGVPDAQAKAHARVAASAFDMHLERLATKDDLRLLASDLRSEMGALRSEMGELRSELRGEMGKLRSELRGEMSEMHSELHGEMSKLRSEMAVIRWMVGPSLVGTLATFAGMMVMMIKNFA